MHRTVGGGEGGRLGASARHGAVSNGQEHAASSRWERSVDGGRASSRDHTIASAAVTTSRPPEAKRPRLEGARGPPSEDDDGTLDYGPSYDDRHRTAPAGDKADRRREAERDQSSAAPSRPVTAPSSAAFVSAREGSAPRRNASEHVPSDHAGAIARERSGPQKENIAPPAPPTASSSSSSSSSSTAAARSTSKSPAPAGASSAAAPKRRTPAGGALGGNGGKGYIQRTMTSVWGTGTGSR